MKYVQDPPFAVQIELTEGCNLYCTMCGLQGIRTQTVKNFKLMKPKTLERLVSQMKELDWHARVEFAMHGEPTQHPEYWNMVARVRKELPKNQLMMTSNGGGLLRPPGVVANLKRLFDNGLNVFAFDAYEYVKIKDKVDEALAAESGAELPEDRPFEVHRYPDEKDWSPHNRYGKDARVFIRVKDIMVAEKGTHSMINNHCGAGGPPLAEPLKARCAKPFRELSVRWDGNVAICCNTWDGKYKIGNINDMTLDEIWQSERFMAARKFLMQGDRGAINPCKVCDAKSYRVGLLPDQRGNKTMPVITHRDRQIVKVANSERPFTKMLKRPWTI